MASTTTGTSLERNAIGLTEVLFQSITHMAPAVATALSIGAATSFAGGITPLAVVLALIAALFTAYSIGELARHLPSAGGMYTYVARGLGSFAGWLMAWAFLLAEPIVPSALYASFGLFGAAFITTLTGYTNDFLWLPLAVLCGLVVWFLVFRGITISTRVGVALGLIEISIFVVISALLIANAPDPIRVSVFIPPGGNILPALQGMVFTLLAFVGFEAAAPLAEETRDPKQTIRQAVILSAILIGIFYVFCYYAATVFFGPDKMQAEFLTSNNSDPWGGMANQVLPGIGSLLVTFAILNSSLANANAGANASTRAIFALGRSRILPGALAAVHPSYRTPVNAVHLQGVLGIVLAVALGLLFRDVTTGGPLTTYIFIGYTLGLLFAGMYMAVNIASLGYYLGEGRAELNAIKHVVVPIVGVILLIPAFLGVLGGVTIPLLNIDLPPLASPYNIAPPLVGLWMLAGIVLYFVLRARAASTLERVGDVMTEA
ncbi:MAG TPA: APC family permease [Candidatus Limnocylindrales bacterium]|nr:APC family permease [Candidatus Limnocylindrales bacterium]